MKVPINDYIFNFDNFGEIFLDQITDYNIHIVEEMNKKLFPVEYGKSFYQELISGSSSQGFFFKFQIYTIGVCTFKIKGKECYIMTFGILPSYRNMGVGSLCIEMIEKYVIFKYNIECIKLHVHVDNKIGINFYKNNNYIIIDMEEDYYAGLFIKSAYVLIKNFY